MNAWLVLVLALFASVAFAASDLPAPIQALQKHGLTIRGKMPAPPGYKGYLADFKGQSLPVYLLPDGKHTVVGNLFDANGKDLTSGPFTRAMRPALDAKAWKALEDSAWIAEGAKHPKRVVYVISDTECPYCHRLWEKVQPLLAGGTVQVRYVMVAVISHDSMGRAAAILSAKDPAAALRRHEANYGHSPFKPMQPVPAKQRERLEANNTLMDALGVTGTPAVFYHDADGKLQRLDGLPSDDRAIRAIFGS